MHQHPPYFRTNGTARHWQTSRTSRIPCSISAGAKGNRKSSKELHSLFGVLLEALACLTLHCNCPASTLETLSPVFQQPSESRRCTPSIASCKGNHAVTVHVYCFIHQPIQHLTKRISKMLRCCVSVGCALNRLAPLALHCRVLRGFFDMRRPTEQLSSTQNPLPLPVSPRSFVPRATKGLDRPRIQISAVPKSLTTT